MDNSYSFTYIFMLDDSGKKTIGTKFKEIFLKKLRNNSIYGTRSQLTGVQK